jgi:hypothetical protein
MTHTPNRPTERPRDLAQFAKLVVDYLMSRWMKHHRSTTSKRPQLAFGRIAAADVEDAASVVELHDGWYSFETARGADCSRPGLYEWHIDGRGSYIGKYTHISRPTKEYGRNVRRLLNGQHYRKGKPDRFRRIHRELVDAVRGGRRIRLIILENPPDHEINRRERQLIEERGNLNGPRRVSPNSK